MPEIVENPDCYDESKGGVIMDYKTIVNRYMTPAKSAVNSAKNVITEAIKIFDEGKITLDITDGQKAAFRKELADRFEELCVLIIAKGF